jgi:hypothetical protein
MEAKHPLKSKTLWLNLIIGIVAMIPNENVQNMFSEANLVVLLSAVNLVLRMVTKNRIGLE